MEPRDPAVEPLYRVKQTLSSRFLRDPNRDGLVLSSRSVEQATAAAATGRNVHAVGIGHKIVNGQLTGDLCVRIYVTQKLDPSLLGNNALPAEIDGVPTDVIESAPAFLLPTVAAAEEIAVPVPGIEGVQVLAPAAVPPCSLARRRRQRPIRGGISAALFSVTAGTISCFCRSTRPGDDPEQVYVLSNNHVFADVNQGIPGAPIFQPGPADGGSNVDEVARLSRFVPIQINGVLPNRVDGAIGQLLPQIPFDASICSIGPVAGTAMAAEGMRVRKHGRTTGLTEGAVVDIAYDALVGMDHANPAIVALFEDQLRIERVAPHPVFGMGGDSGSLVMQADGQNAVGLYFAGPPSGLYGIANPIGAVLTELEITLL